MDRAILIRQSLRSRGYQAEIVLGVIRETGQPLKGHAWVKYKDRKTGEWKEIKNY